MSSNKDAKWCFSCLLMHLWKFSLLDLLRTRLLVSTQVKASAKGVGSCKLEHDATALLSKATWEVAACTRSAGLDFKVSLWTHTVNLTRLIQQKVGGKNWHSKIKTVWVLISFWFVMLVFSECFKNLSMQIIPGSSLKCLSKFPVHAVLHDLHCPCTGQQRKAISLRQDLNNQLHTKCTESVPVNSQVLNHHSSETLHYNTCASSNVKVKFS